MAVTSFLVSIALVGFGGALAQGDCLCNFPPQSAITICGTDGVTYPTVCDLNKAQKANPKLGMRGFGQCAGITEYQTLVSQRCNSNQGYNQQRPPPPPPFGPGGGGPPGFGMGGSSGFGTNGGPDSGMGGGPGSGMGRGPGSGMGGGPGSGMGGGPGSGMGGGQGFGMSGPGFMMGMRVGKRQAPMNDDRYYGGQGGYGQGGYGHGGGYGNYGYGGPGYGGYYGYYQRPPPPPPPPPPPMPTVCLTNGSTVTGEPSRLSCIIAQSSDKTLGIRCPGSCSSCGAAPKCPVPVTPVPGQSTVAPPTSATANPMDPNATIPPIPPAIPDFQMFNMARAIFESNA